MLSSYWECLCRYATLSSKLLALLSFNGHAWPLKVAWIFDGRPKFGSAENCYGKICNGRISCESRLKFAAAIAVRTGQNCDGRQKFAMAAISRGQKLQLQQEQ
jgi:hypothetical protein